MTTLFLTIITITGLWVIAVIVLREYTDHLFVSYKQSLKGKIVVFSKTLRRDEKIASRYGKIMCVDDTNKAAKVVLTVQVYILPSEAEEQLRYNKWLQWKEKMLSDTQEKIDSILHPKSQLDAGKPYLRGGWSSNFGYTDAQRLAHLQELYQDYAQQVYAPNQIDLETVVVPFRQVKVMPKNFDYLSGRLVKPLEPKDPTKRGGEKIVRRMPRVFRFALYLALVVVVYDIVLNMNNITFFVVRTFILHAK